MIIATYIDHMGTDLSVVNAARVSFGKRSTWEGQEDGLYDGKGGRGVLAPRDKKLIAYLAKHKHMSPFGHAFASFHVKAPVFVARQLVKHKFLRWNEISRRYVDSEPEFYEPVEWRGRSEDKKQGSSGRVEVGKIGDISLTSKVLYNSLLDRGVCPEQARMVLPQSTMTEWYWSGSLDAFADMCRLRVAPDTQEETRQVAEQIDTVMYELFPTSWYELMVVK